jgi:tetratricopeptide (TPR) repeat protein
MRSVNDQRLFVFSYMEIFGLFITFSFALFFLYPRQMLEQQVLSESSNYDLTVAYLESMLKHDPSNEPLMLALANASYRNGKLALAMHLDTLLEHSSNKQIQNEALVLRYKLYKQKTVVESGAGKLSPAQKQVLVGLLKQISEHHTPKTLAELEEWYAEAQWLGQHALAMRWSDMALKRAPNDPRWLERCAYTAVALHQIDKAVSCLDPLTELQPDKREKWLKERYYLLLNRSYSDARQTLQRLIELDSRWEKELPNLELYWKHYETAAAYYRSRAETAASRETKIANLIKSISILQQGLLLKKAVDLAKHNEPLVLDDPRASTVWLRLYLAAGETRLAANFSDKLLKHRQERP